MSTAPGPVPGPAPAGVFTASEQGFAVVGLRTARAELRMVPALGGRITGLRSLRTGREWCWHQPRPDWLWANRPGDPFGASPQAGIDECVPTVAPCRVKGRALPDHGEAWFQAWDLDPAALAEGVLQAAVALPVSPFVFGRAIRAGAGGTFVFDYTLRNTGTDLEPYLWSFHPLLRLEAGDRLELPEEVRALRLDGGLGAPIARGDLWAYPEPFPGVRLDACEVPGMPGGCVKGFAGPLATGGAAVANGSTGDRLAFHWDAAVLPHLGLWINRGHGGFHHLGVEPCSGAPDSLAEAVGDWGQFSLLPPGETARWSLALEVS